MSSVADTDSAVTGYWQQRLHHGQELGSGFYRPYAVTVTQAATFFVAEPGTWRERRCCERGKHPATPTINTLAAASINPTACGGQQR